MFEANQTDARHSKAMLQLWSEACGQLLLHHLRFNAEVGENSSANNTLNDWQSHGGFRLSPALVGDDCTHGYGWVVNSRRQY